MTSDIRLISRLLSVSDCCFINVLFIAKLSSQIEILSTALQHQTDILTRDQFCPANGGVSFINTGNCYLESSQATSDWNEARAECQKNGGDLATIDSQATQDFLVENLKGITSSWFHAMILMTSAHSLWQSKWHKSFCLNLGGGGWSKA